MVAQSVSDSVGSASVRKDVGSGFEPCFCDTFLAIGEGRKLSLCLADVLLYRVEPLTSILAVLARSRQILSTSWQPWIPWQDLTKILHYSKIVSYHNGQNSKIIKNTVTSVQAAESQSKGSFHPTTTISTTFHNQNASTC